MRKSRSLVSMRTLTRIFVVAVIGGGAAACGSDVVRLGDNPFSNPFAGSQRFENRSAPAAAGAPDAAGQSAPVATVAAAPLAPPAVAAAPLGAPGVPSSGRPPSAPSTPSSSASSGGWTAAGGSVVTPAPGESIRTLANRYGVPEAALRSANNLPAGSQPAPGQKIVIPVFNVAVAPAGRNSPVQTPAASPAPVQTTKGTSVGQDPSQAARSNGGQPSHHALQSQSVRAQGTKVGDTKAVPKQQVAALDQGKADPKAAKPPQSGTSVDIRVDPKTAKPDPKTVSKNEAKPEPQKAAAAPAAVTAPETTASVASDKTGSEFRWPARGRIISGFGNKGGQSNDGISIAVPEGTPVKAAEGGVVGYAGNELKGYGNLVLIRHDNGFVTVYAHNGELKVKRGESVKRGQVIATSGQTGNVSSPQLKFEIRKGQTPVDPLEYLSGN
jgi:murein DD-endopeptidase MepM/ murein hydrolase activator NlpD